MTSILKKLFLFFSRTSQSLYDICLSTYECIICTEYMHPPIRQCQLGHNYCNNCCKKMESCPICKSPHSVSNNIPMETFHLYIRFPCKHRNKGCTFAALNGEIETHQLTCVYNWKLCPFNSFGFCTWLGPQKAIAAHCQEVHSNSFIDGPTATYHWPQFNAIEDNQCVDSLIYAHGQIFHCKLKVYSEERRKKCSIFINYLGDPEESYGYYFNVNVIHPTSQRNIQIKAPCNYAMDGLNYELFEGYCNKVGNLKLVIDILDRQPCIPIGDF